MSDHLAHSARGVTDEFRYRHVRTHGEAHRQDVRHHGRSASRQRRHACRQRNVENDVLSAGQTMHEDCRDGSRKLRQAHPDAVCDRSQLPEGRGRHRAGVANETARPRPCPIAEAQRLRQAGQGIGPVLTILLVSLGRAVFRLIREHRSERAETAGWGGQPSRKRRIDLGHAPGNECEANAIRHDVMVARIPKEAVRRRLEQRIAE
jgi:hypothetical protein